MPSKPAPASVTVTEEVLPPEPVPAAGEQAPEGGVVVAEAVPVAQVEEVPATDSLTPGIRIRNF